MRKILRSLPESFHAKVTTIEESKDLDEIKVQELIGSLQTYELSLLKAQICIKTQELFRPPIKNYG